MDSRRFGRFRFDLSTRALALDGRPVPLQARTAHLLELLLLRSPELVPRDELFSALWPDGFVEDGNLPQQIYHLRKVLDGDPEVRIETERRRGYRLVAPLPALVPAEPATARRSWTHRLAAVAAALVAGLLAVVVPSSTVGSKQQALAGSAATSYRLGMYYFQRRTKAGDLQAMREFQRTVDLAPRSPQGYAGRGLMEVQFASVAAAMKNSSPNVYAGADLDAHHALALGEDSAAHAILGFIALRRDGDAAVAAAQFRRAIDLDPNDSVAHEWYGISLLYDGRLAAARAEFEEALRTDPSCALNFYWLAVAQFYQGEYAEARVSLDEMAGLKPPPGVLLVAATLRQQIAEEQGDVRGAVELAGQIGREANDPCYREATMFRLARLAHATRDAALPARVPSCTSDTDVLASVSIALALGHDDDAMRALRAVRAIDPWSAHFSLLYDPRLKRLRSRPDFAAILL